MSATPETPVLLRTSERSTYKRCRQLWYWHYVLETESSRHRGALKFGSAVHGALELYYPPGKKRGPHPAETFTRLIEEMGDFSVWTDDEDDAKHSAEELGVIMLEGYVDLYGRDQELEVIQPEMDFQIDVLMKNGKYLVTYVGSFDCIIKWRGEDGKWHFGILEHKTGKSIEEVLINSKYGEQGITYLWAASIWLKHHNLMPKDAELDMILYNWLRKGKPDTRPRNAQGHYLNKPKKDALVEACKSNSLKLVGTMDVLRKRLRNAGIDPDLLGEVSKKQARPLFHRQELSVAPHQLAQVEARLRAEAWEMQQVRKGNIPVYKNPDTHCNWCDYKDVCELHELGSDWQSVLELEFKPWDPYESHRDAMMEDA